MKYKKKAWLKGNLDKVKQISKELSDLGDNFNNMKSAINELQEMKNDDKQIFTFNKTVGDIGVTKKDGNIITMNIADGGSITNGIHESSHGYDVWKKGMPKNSNELYETEIKAYGRQFSLSGGNAMPCSDGETVTSLSDINPRYILGIQDNKGGYLYAPSILGSSYTPKEVRRILNKN